MVDAAAGQQGVIVLDLSERKAPSLELLESNDPATIRRMVRRQAALASAGRRKATIAATAHVKRVHGPTQPSSASSSSLPSTGGGGGSANGQGSGRGRKKKTAEQRNAPPDGDRLRVMVGTASAAAAPVGLSNGRIDPFDSQPIEFDVVKDPSLLTHLFHLFMSNVAPLLDLRLPTQSDRRYGRRYSWQTELPQMALSSAPCFWAMMLGSSTNVSGDEHPASSVVALGFRHMAIRSINQTLMASPPSFGNNFGLLIGIAMLGSWERWWGSKEACKAHCDGLDLLRRHFNEKDQPHDLLEQITAFAAAFGSSAPQTLSAEDILIKLQDKTTIGFTEVVEQACVDRGLVGAICHCQDIEQMPPGEHRTEALHNLATALLSFDTKSKVKDAMLRDPNRGADNERINLEMHIVLQAAGIVMLTSLAGSPSAAGTQDIDVTAMCDEVADLSRSIMWLPVYDRLLLWVMITVFALGDVHPPSGLSILRTLLERRQLYHLPIAAVTNDMAAFVFLDTSREQYHALLALVMPELPLSETRPEEDHE